MRRIEDERLGSSRACQGWLGWRGTLTIMRGAASLMVMSTFAADDTVTARWDERLTTRQVEHRGKQIHVVGC